MAVLAGIVLSKPFFLGADSAHHYAHVWYISDQLFRHGRLPLRVASLESGQALTFPYGVVPWMLAAPFRLILGDWAVTAIMVLGFALYGYSLAVAFPALRDVRLLSLVYADTFLIEALVSFQMAFLWSLVLFFFFVAALNRRRWVLATSLATGTFLTHPFAGLMIIPAALAWHFVRRPEDRRVLLAVGALTAALVAPYALYLHGSPVFQDTRRSYLVGTLRWIARYRSPMVALPLGLAAASRPARRAYLPLFLAMALVFGHRILHQDVNTFGLDRYSRPFYGAFIRSPAFDRSLVYRVLEPNDREDGAYQLFRHGAVLAQDFFDQSQMRRWWDTLDQYTCFLSARRVDMVILEKDYPLKFSQNEDVRLRELEERGQARVWFRDERGRFTVYDVRGARREPVRLADCHL
ncbi:MAG TPA: hypothetical protein VNN21_05385 [Dehalococcoidia bacterium]|nr:hypothetical protein [Dehalococcoidia bacterium]